MVEEKLPMLLLNILPKYTASAAIKARSKLQEAFSAYYENGGDGNEEAPDFVRAKKDLAQMYDLSKDYTPRADIGELMAMLFNVSPSSFWMVANVFSRPSLLQDLRDEVQEVIKDQTIFDELTGEERTTCHVDAPHLQRKCPLLVATFKEVLRFTGAVTTNRYVMEDTKLNEDRFFRKGGIVQIPGGVMHFDKSIWGDDVDEFKPQRFIGSKQRHHPSAFRAFGGGATLCPGRHLAMTEILALTAALIHGFDIAPKNSIWCLPKMKTKSLPGILKPMTDVKVVIVRRPALEKANFVFESF